MISSLRDNTHMTSMKIAQFSKSLSPLVHLCPKFFYPVDLGCPIPKKPLPLQIIAIQLKKNIIQGWLLYVIRSFLQAGFRFQYRSSRPEVFCKISVLRNFTKFTGKHLCQSLFFSSLERWKRHFCDKITKNFYCEDDLFIYFIYFQFI